MSKKKAENFAGNEISGKMLRVLEVMNEHDGWRTATDIAIKVNSDTSFIRAKCHDAANFGLLEVNQTMINGRFTYVYRRLDKLGLFMENVKRQGVVHKREKKEGISTSIVTPKGKTATIEMTSDTKVTTQKVAYTPYQPPKEFIARSGAMDAFSIKSRGF